jgi:hypothetical protein
VPTHNRQFSTALFMQHFTRGVRSFFLCAVNASCAIGIIALVHPFTVSAEYTSA